jgi:hypothetical protein
VAPIAYNNAVVPIFISGTKDMLLRVMENRGCIPNNSVVLLLDDGSIEDFLDDSTLTVLEDDQTALEWRSELKEPALILAYYGIG